MLKVLKSEIRLQIVLLGHSARIFKLDFKKLPHRFRMFSDQLLHAIDCIFKLEDEWTTLSALHTLHEQRRTVKAECRIEFKMDQHIFQKDVTGRIQSDRNVIK